MFHDWIILAHPDEPSTSQKKEVEASDSSDDDWFQALVRQNNDEMNLEGSGSYSGSGGDATAAQSNEVRQTNISTGKYSKC